jgi:hypothetical protein
MMAGNTLEVIQMSEALTMEARLEAVERDVAELKVLVRRTPEPRPWYERTIGSMKDFPEFDEVVRLGRELRKADNREPEPA